jgi:hypothetical protein
MKGMQSVSETDVSPGLNSIGVKPKASTGKNKNENVMQNEGAYD